MNDEYVIRPIAHIKNDLKTKFGVPRQSGLVSSVVSEIIFTPEYRNPEALRGLEDFSHIWLIWGFSESRREEFTPTVRPPRLGGNIRLGVFATRSPFRPNSLALSCVRLQKIEGDRLFVLGADLMNGTPIYDIKPYIPYADCIESATGGFAPNGGKTLSVVSETDSVEKIPEDKRESLFALLARDPRPQYHDDPARVYGMEYADFEVKFRVEGETLYIISVE